MLGSRPLFRTTAFAPRSDSRREKPFHQERPALFVASPNHNPKLPILSISYLSRFLLSQHSRILRDPVQGQMRASRQAEQVGTPETLAGDMYIPCFLFFGSSD